jgi:hypothetical protein
MKSVAVTSQTDWKDFEHFESYPWSEFKNEILRMGFRIVSLKEKPDLVVVLNHKPLRSGWSLGCRAKPKKVLVVFEPIVVAPINHVKRIREKYSQIYVPSPFWRMSDSEQLFTWPQTDVSNLELEKVSIDRMNKFAMILGNHISVSKSEQYSLRREIASKSNLPIDIYGPNWNDSPVINLLRSIKSLLRFIFAFNYRITFPRLMNSKAHSYHGVVKDKFQTYSKYRFSLVIENSPDYISEKLIDALVAGTIPIYVGPNLEKLGIPEGVALQVDANSDAISRGIFELLESKDMQTSILRSGQEFLSSTPYLEMVNGKSLATLANKIIAEFLRSENEYR